MISLVQKKQVSDGLVFIILGNSLFGTYRGVHCYSEVEDCSKRIVHFIYLSDGPLCIEGLWEYGRAHCLPTNITLKPWKVYYTRKVQHIFHWVSAKYTLNSTLWDLLGRLNPCGWIRPCNSGPGAEDLCSCSYGQCIAKAYNWLYVQMFGFPSMPLWVLHFDIPFFLLFPLSSVMCSFTPLIFIMPFNKYIHLHFFQELIQPFFADNRSVHSTA